MSNPTQRPEVTRGLELIAQGSTLRAAAIAVGVDKSSLVRARKRGKLAALPAGRPPVVGSKPARKASNPRVTAPAALPVKT